jgi:hypothetical protein
VDTSGVANVAPDMVALPLADEPLLPLAVAPAAPPPLPRPARASPGQMKVAILGRVTSSKAGQLVVDLGRQHGVDVGNRIELSVTSRSALGPFENREVLAVGRVISVADERSLVEVGIGESIPVGAEAALSSRPLTNNRMAPPRVAGTWTIAAIVRPFFVLEQLGAGMLNELSIGYQSESPLRYQLLASPVGFSSAEDGSTVAAAVIALVSFDTRLFEIGLGVGAQSVNDSDYTPGSGVTVSQSLRVGALDGLHLAIRNDISLFHSEFEYSAFNGQAQIPVADRGWLVLQGGGGSVGYGFFEVGGKALLVGNGAPGSLFVRGTIGYATLFEDRGILSLPSSNGFFEDDVNHAGPLVGLGIEWRM